MSGKVYRVSDPAWRNVEGEECEQSVADLASISATHRCLLIAGQRVFLPKGSLTEVRPPIPDEPEPGAYLIGGVLCVQFGTRAGAQWLADTNATPTLRLRMDWPAFVEAMGITADTPIEPLVRKATLPEVKLPWAGKTKGDSPIEVLHDDTPERGIKLFTDGWGFGLTAPVAREMAAALLAAAGEVRSS